MKYAKLVTVIVVVFSVGSTALADWDPGDDHKMHYPQLPDPSGWDVNFSNQNILADDWRCSESGPVKDIHFWFSVHEEPLYPANMQIEIMNIHISIHDDIPAGAGGLPWSSPAPNPWVFDFPGPEATVRFYGSGPQGWIDPVEQVVILADHFNIYQANIDLGKILDEAQMFHQEMDNIYWLDLSVDAVGIVDDGTGNPLVFDLQVGWKTSQDHFNDAAVFDASGGLGLDWQPLFDPLEQHLDMAFVITPEPATMSLLCIGGLAVLRRRKRR